MQDFKAAFTAKTAIEGWIADYVRPGQVVSAIESFAYNTRFNTITKGTLFSNLIQIQADSDFLCTAISANILAGQVPTQNPWINLQLTDLSSGKTLFNRATTLRQVAGSFGMPFILPIPRVMRPNTNIQVDITSNDSLAQPPLFVSLWGARVYY